MADCVICGKPIIDESYVVSNRRIYHLHHEDQDHIDIEQYEIIIADLKKLLVLSAREVDEKNNFLVENITTIEDLQKAKDIRVETVKVLQKELTDLRLKIEVKDVAIVSLKSLKTEHQTESKRLFDELSIFKSTNKNLTKEIVEHQAFKEKIKKLGLTDDTKE